MVDFEPNIKIHTVIFDRKYRIWKKQKQLILGRVMIPLITTSSRNFLTQKAPFCIKMAEVMTPK